MLRYFLLVSLLLIFASACTPTAAEPLAQQNIESEAAHEDEHDDHADEETEHSEDEHDEHSSDEDGDEHDDHEGEEEFRDHGAHEHGAAELMIAWSGNELAIDLQTPAYNVLGFEHAPTSDEEQAMLDDSVAVLETGEILQFNAEANCTLISASVETELAEEKHEEHEDEDGHDEHEDEAEHSEHEDEEAHEEHEEEVHSDIAVSYNIQCEQPDKLELLDLSGLFIQFPNFEDLRAQWISDVEQSAKALTADDSILTLK